MTNPLNLRQAFNMADVCRLEVERDPAGAELLNLLPNSSGALGAWGWTTPVSGTRMTVSGGTFTFITTAAQAAYFISDIFAATAGTYISAAYDVVAGGTAPYHRARFVWLDANKAVLGYSERTAYMPGGTATTRYTAAQAPTGTAYVQLRLDLYSNRAGSNPAANASLKFTNPRVISTAAPRIVVRTNLFGSPRPADLTDWTASSAGVAAGSWPVMSIVTAPAPPQGTTALRTQHQGGTTDEVRYNPSGLVTPVNAGAKYVASFHSLAASTARAVQIVANWTDVNGSDLSSNTASVGNNSTAAYVRLSATFTAPAGAYGVYFIWRVTTSTAGELHYWNGFMVEQADALGTYIEDTQLISGTLPMCPSVYWIDITDGIRSISLPRPELDTGTMSVVLASDDLDPAVSSVLRPGRRIRLTARPDLANPATVEDLFYGVMGKPKSTFDPLGKPNRPRSVITFTATDAVDRLSSTPQSTGVGTIANIPAVLEGANTPWNVNGSRDQVASAAVVAVDDSASALDQVVRTRDSVLGYAWVDRHGVLQAWDAASLSTATRATLDETVYDAEPVIDYDFDRTINAVSVVIKDANGDEATYGPYLDNESVRLNGVCPAVFTVQGIASGAVQSYVISVLAANSKPVRRIESVTIPIRTETLGLVTLDLYDRVRVVNARSGIDTLMRVAGITHTITPARWDIEVSFAVEGRSATPTVGSGVVAAATVTPAVDGAWVNLPLSFGTTGTARYMVLNGFAYLHFEPVLFNTAIGASGTTTVASPGALPVGVRPLTMTRGQATNSAVLHRIDVAPDGSVTVAALTGGSNGCFGFVIWPAGK